MVVVFVLFPFIFGMKNNSIVYDKINNIRMIKIFKYKMETNLLKIR